MKILIVEDEHRIANSIKKGLQMEKMVADVAYDGIKGFDLACEGSYDVVLLDLMLPGMDGVEICKKMRAEGNHTPILILTAKGQVEDKIEGLGSGADDYLTKPFAFEELLARIKALARRPQKLEETIFKFIDLELNRETYEIKLRGKIIDLSQKEYGLMEYLLRNGGRVVTKDQIRDHVWDYETKILPNTIEVYIKKLRKKGIGIVTVRGFGYKLTGIANV